MYGFGYLVYGLPAIIGAFIGAKRAENKAMGLLVGIGVGLAVGRGIKYGLNYRGKKEQEEREARRIRKDLSIRPLS